MADRRPAGGAPPAFQVMLKPRGPVCNLACTYCYYRGKAELYPGSDFRMTDQVLERFTAGYIAAQRVPEVTFHWQGGEPLLMGLGFFRRAVALQARYGRPGMRIANALQTNGTRITAAWASFFREQGFLVGVSLDGPQALHDAYRRDAGGAGSHARALRGLRVLQRHGVDLNVLTCVHAANAGQPLEVYRFLRDEAEAEFIQFIPVVHPDGQGALAEPSVSGEQYGRFLIAVFDEWLRNDVGRVGVQLFEATLAAWMGLPPPVCAVAPTCGLGPVLEHNGDLYACDHFVTPRHRLGNVLDTPLAEMVASAHQRRFGLAKRDGLPEACLACEVRFACHGGCPKNRLASTNGVNALCAGYRAFFRHVDRPMHALAAALRAGRDPAQAARALGTHAAVSPQVAELG